MRTLCKRCNRYRYRDECVWLDCENAKRTLAPHPIEQLLIFLLVLTLILTILKGMRII